eukprot:COSAG01_NODE_21038_length_921_cov_1.188564_1_plen_184_part_01
MRVRAVSNSAAQSAQPLTTSAASAPQARRDRTGRTTRLWVLHHLPVLLAIAVAAPAAAATVSGAPAAPLARRSVAVGRSGCTDSAADNFEPGAVVDDGGCAYSCEALVARLGAPNGSHCSIYDLAAGTWTGRPSNGAVVQGRPAAGWRPGSANDSRPAWLPPLTARLHHSSVPRLLRYANASHF